MTRVACVAQKGFKKATHCTKNECEEDLHRHRFHHHKDAGPNACWDANKVALVFVFCGLCASHPRRVEQNEGGSNSTSTYMCVCVFVCLMTGEVWLTYITCGRPYVSESLHTLHTFVCKDVLACENFVYKDVLTCEGSYRHATRTRVHAHACT